ncbi:hypothetical protein EJ08DRAFT_273703 [Tothia fuscella]|uniref:Uncharacterized protein n=1 Tax=Tothia fuscella TaxID=1048955 RepID=A0A9P4TXR4_9PEZI|nr:hypothetical protein EJ08DRAFT_273703 [Tothia fuscella]
MYDVIDLPIWVWTLLCLLFAHWAHVYSQIPHRPDTLQRPETFLLNHVFPVVYPFLIPFSLYHFFPTQVNTLLTAPTIPKDGDVTGYILFICAMVVCPFTITRLAFTRPSSIGEWIVGIVAFVVGTLVLGVVMLRGLEMYYGRTI